MDFRPLGEFQSLIGRAQTVNRCPEHQVIVGFQSLIGRAQTIDEVKAGIIDPGFNPS